MKLEVRYLCPQSVNFLLMAAGPAEENGIEMILIGKNTAFDRAYSVRNKPAGLVL